MIKNAEVKKEGKIQNITENRCLDPKAPEQVKAPARIPEGSRAQSCAGNGTRGQTAPPGDPHSTGAAQAFPQQPAPRQHSAAPRRRGTDPLLRKAGVQRKGPSSEEQCALREQLTPMEKESRNSTARCAERTAELQQADRTSGQFRP